MRLSGRALLPLAVLVLFAAVLGGSSRAPAGDGPHMLSQALRLGGWLRQGELGAAAGAFTHLTAPHPPFGYVPLALLAAFTRDVRVLVAAADVVWLLLLLDGTMRLARPAPWWAGQVAWALAAASGLTWWSADHAGFDLAAAAATVQALGWLHASDSLRKRGPAIAFGLWLAAAFLTKYTAPLILAVPVLVGCAPALRRAPVNLAIAVVAWAALFAPWGAENGSVVVAYVRSALVPPDVAGNLPSAQQGSGALAMLAALKECLGWPALVVLLGSALWGRRWIPLAGVVGGLVLLGAMNSREPRYVLPLVWLAAAAGAPTSRSPWQHAAVLAAIALPSMRAAATVYATCGPDCAPARRPFEIPAAMLQTWGAWPNPPVAFRPISEHPERWNVEEVVATFASSPVVVVLGAASEAPEVTTYQLEVERQGLGVDLEVVVARLGQSGVEGTSHVGPFPRDGGVARLAYVVDTGASTAGMPGGPGAATGSVAAAWLATRPHTVLRTWALPQGAVGSLVTLEGGGAAGAPAAGTPGFGMGVR